MPHILVVDDDPHVRSFMERCLRRKYSVSTAQDVEEGILRARIEEPALIFTDYELGRSTGYEIPRALKEDGNQAKMVLMSGNPDARRQDFHAYFDEFIAKPFESISIIYEVAERLLNSSQPSQQ